MKKINEFLFFQVHKFVKDKDVHSAVMEENLRFAVIWSAAQMVYWAYCIIMSTQSYDFWLCRKVYIAAYVACAIALLLALFLAKKQIWLIQAIAFIVDIALLGAGVGIASYLAPKTIVIFASVLMVPVFFICSSLSTLVLLVFNIIAFNIIGRQSLSDYAFHWTLTNLVIFSTVGLLLGHFVNKTRYERYYYAVSTDRLTKKLEQYAYYDQLTGLFNRRAYSERIDELEQHLPDDICFIMADVNGLKKANDTLGHDAGDELLIGAADCLRKCFEGLESIYRIGGDEFCIITNQSEDYISQHLQEFDRLCSEWKGKYQNRLSVSYGHAFSKDYKDIVSLVKAADQRMYMHKREFYELRQNL